MAPAASRVGHWRLRSPACAAGPRRLVGQPHRESQGISCSWPAAGAHAVFDGCAMLVRFELTGARNQVVVSQRFLETTYYQHYKSTGEWVAALARTCSCLLQV